MRFETPNGAMDIEIGRLVIAGWTARDSAAMERHIEELMAIGVAPPSATPLYYRVSASLLTQADGLEVVGTESSGEVEPFIVISEAGPLIGVGSDHTDRGLEVESVVHAKQVCGKIVSGEVWPLAEVADLDALILTSEIFEAGAWRPYQEGPVAKIRPLSDLISAAALSTGEAMLCGTLPAIGGVRPAERFRMSLTDPNAGRQIAKEYAIRVLPVIS